MSSINTNLSAMTALQALKATQNAMSKNQGQISTGLRVAEASHNASYWSIATGMKSDNGALSAVRDSIGQSKAMINTFSSAMDKTLTYLNKMKAGLVAASQPGADLQKIQTEFDANIEGMKSSAGSASFNGQNWLSGNATLVNLVSSYDGVNNKVGTLAIDTSKTQLFKDAAAGTGGLLADVAAIDISA
uniref:flagellin N-terminal helical domain-containing protein n=1 Tax=Microvirga sp. G4-2 TaxID=3434467 RepID=UPI004044FB00